MTLLEIAEQYSSEEEFKAKNYHKYLLAKKQQLLKKVFGRDIKPKKPTTDILMVYRRGDCIRIATGPSMSENDIKAVTAPITNATQYKLYKLPSAANAFVLYHYLVAKFRPVHNTDVPTDKLTIKIPNLPSKLGTPVVVSLLN